MRSNGRPSHHVVGSAASPARTSAARPRRARFSRDARQARGVAIERDEIDIGAFEHMRGLAARRGARIEHALAVGEIEQIGDALRGAVLHREQAFGITRQARHVGAFVRARSHRRDRVRVGRDAGGAQALRADASRVARRRLTRSVSGASRLFASRIASTSSGQSRRERVDQPARMRGARDGVAIERRIDRRALAREAAQHRVDEAAMARLAELARRVDRERDDRVVRQTEHRDLRQREHEQRAHVARFRRQRFFEQRVERGVEPQPPARRCEQRRRRATRDRAGRRMRGVASASAARSETPSNTMRAKRARGIAAQRGARDSRVRLRARGARSASRAR